MRAHEPPTPAPEYKKKQSHSLQLLQVAHPIGHRTQLVAAEIKQPGFTHNPSSRKPRSSETDTDTDRYRQIQTHNTKSTEPSLQHQQTRLPKHVSQLSVRTMLTYMLNTTTKTSRPHQNTHRNTSLTPQTRRCSHTTLTVLHPRHTNNKTNTPPFSTHKPTTDI